MIERNDARGSEERLPQVESQGGPRFIRTLGSQSLSGGLNSVYGTGNGGNGSGSGSGSGSVNGNGGLVGGGVVNSIYSSHTQSPVLSNSDSPANGGGVCGLGSPVVGGGNGSNVESTPGGSHGASTPSYRVAQACDRCRAKKIRCDGKRPQCSQCAAVGFECKISDKLSRRAFPRGYTETLEERVRELEAENRRLVALCDLKEEQLHLVSKFSNNEEGDEHVASNEDEQLLHELSKDNGGSLRVSSTNLYLLNKKATPRETNDVRSTGSGGIPVAKVATTAPSPRIVSPRNSVAGSDPLHANMRDAVKHDMFNQSTDSYGISFEQNEAPGLPALKALSSMSKYKQGTQLATLVAVSVPRTTEEILFVPQLLARIGQVHGFTSKQCIYTASVLASLKEANISSIPPELEVLKSKNLWEIDDVIHFWKNVFKLDFTTHTAIDNSSTHLKVREIDELIDFFFQDWYELIPLFDKNEFNIYYQKFRTNVMDPNFFSRKDDTIFNNRTRSISYKIFSCLLVIIIQMGMLSKVKRNMISSGKLNNLMKYYDKLMTHIWVNPYFNSRNTSIQVLQLLTLLLFYMLSVGDVSSIYELRGKVVSMSQQLRLHRCPSAVLGGDGSTVSKVQQGERRVLFWSIYYLDVFSALQLGVPRLLKDIEIECALPVTSDDDKQVNLAGQMIALEGKVSAFSLSVIRFAKVMGNILDSTFKRGMTTSLTKQAALVHENALDNWRHGLNQELGFQLDVNGTINMDEFNQLKQSSQNLTSSSSGYTYSSLTLMTLYFIAKCMVHLPVVATKPLVEETLKKENQDQTEEKAVDRSLSSYVLLQQATNTLLNVLTALNNVYLPLPINLARTKTRFGLFSARGSLEYTKGGALFQDNKTLLLDLIKELEVDKKLGLPSNMSWHSLKLFDLSVNLILQPVNSNPDKTEKMIQKKINYYNKLMGQPTVTMKRKKEAKSADAVSKKVKMEEGLTNSFNNLPSGDTADTVHSEQVMKDVPKELNVYPDNYTTIQEAFQLDPVLHTNPFSNSDLKALFSSGLIENPGQNNSNATLNGLNFGNNGSSLLNLTTALNPPSNTQNPLVKQENVPDTSSASNLLNLSNNDGLFKVPSNGDFLKDYYMNNMTNTNLSQLNNHSVNKGPSMSQLSSLFMSSSGPAPNNLSYSNLRSESNNNLNNINGGMPIQQQHAQPSMDGFSFAADASLGLAPLLAWSPDTKTPVNTGSTGIVLETGENDYDSKHIHGNPIAQLQQQQQQQNHQQQPSPLSSASIPTRKTSLFEKARKATNSTTPIPTFSPPIAPSTQEDTNHLTMPPTNQQRRGPRRRWNSNAGNGSLDSSVSDLLRWQNGSA